MRNPFLAAILAMLAVTPARADPDATVGRDLYIAHCARCHGADAKGDGPEAAMLTLQPKDLTRLSAENGGVFPLVSVARKIDGRDPLAAHGSPMPVYGRFFTGPQHEAMKTDTGQPMLMSTPIADLIAWLISIQD